MRASVTLRAITAGARPGKTHGRGETKSNTWSSGVGVGRGTKNPKKKNKVTNLRTRNSKVSKALGEDGPTEDGALWKLLGRQPSSLPGPPLTSGHGLSDAGRTPSANRTAAY